MEGHGAGAGAGAGQGGGAKGPAMHRRGDVNILLCGDPGTPFCALFHCIFTLYARHLPSLWPTDN